ncbi:MAG: hypothetical protein GX598_02895 [Elusimicrobia bacterium]|nr:hypothetical protein [Elusimicrobiota bacterium]
MKLIVPTNWQDDILRELPLQEISGFYGQLDRDFTGGGRPSCILPVVGRAKAAAHIASIRAKGLSFNYLLNSACMGNTESTTPSATDVNRDFGLIKSIRAAVSCELRLSAQSLTASLKGFTKAVATASPAVNAGSAPKKRARR